MAIVHDPRVRTPSPRPPPLRGEGEAHRPRFIAYRHDLNSSRKFTSRSAYGSRLPLSGGGRDGLRGLRRSGLGAKFLAVAVVAFLTSAARAELVRYAVVGDAIPASLTGAKGDAARGRAIVANHNLGLCLLCHSGPFPEDKFQGNLAPDLAGAGSRWSEGQLRLRIVDAARLNRDTIMPPFYRIDHLRRVPQAYRDKPVLTAVEVEDVVAYLMTLK